VSKPTEKLLLVPGEAGWEIWSGQTEGGFTLHSATDISRPGDLKDLPSGDITLLFPGRSITAVPMRVASDDDALFPDLATLHAERLGLRPDPMAGQLTDVFVIAREAENTALVAVFLRSPGEGDLPPRGPKSFDISARVFPVAGNTLALWKELGRWIFAVYHDGKFVYCQATAVDSSQPDDSLAREIRLSLIQLGMQGLDVDCSRVVVWSNNPATDLSALQDAFKIPVEVAPRPVPVLPSPLSKLLPADVRAARREAQRRRNITFGIAAAAAVYLGVIGWFGYGVWKTMAETKKVLAEAEEAAPDAEEYALHMAKWNELAFAIDLKNSPVDILKRIADCIPPNSGLRLKSADISATEIKLQGEAQQLPPVNTFNLKLNKNSDLLHFKWETPPPNQTTRGWEFVYSAEVPNTEAQP